MKPGVFAAPIQLQDNKLAFRSKFELLPQLPDIESTACKRPQT